MIFIIEIGKRENELLELIAEYGGIYQKDARKIYINAQHYAYKRVRKLLDEKYLIRGNNILYLGSRGKQYIEDKNKSYRNVGTDKDLRKRSAEMYKLFSKLESFDTMPSFKMERITKNFAYRYYGKVMSNAGKEYWLYRIGRLVLKDDDLEGNERKSKGKELEIHKLKNEIEEIKNTLKNMNLMIFIEDKMSMDIYKRILGSIAVEEHIILPYVPSGLAIANEYIGKGEGDNNKVFQKLTSQGIKVRLGHNSWITADYDIENTFGINLTTNDYNKEIKLKNYLSLTNKPQNLTIICSEVQECKYTSEYPGCSMLIVK